MLEWASKILILPLLLGHPDKRFTIAIHGERDDQEEGRAEAGAQAVLSVATDPAGLQSTYTYYDQPRWLHYLKTIGGTPPFPQLIARHEYDNDGRLVASVDGEGKRLEYTHDIAGQVEVMDRMDPSNGLSIHRLTARPELVATAQIDVGWGKPATSTSLLRYEDRSILTKPPLRNT